MPPGIPGLTGWWGWGLGGLVVCELDSGREHLTRQTICLLCGVGVGVVSF